MRMLKLSLIILLAATSCMAAELPEYQQLAFAADNPHLMLRMLKRHSIKDAARITVEAIRFLKESLATKEEQQSHAAILTAALIIIAGDEASSVLTTLVEGLSPDLLPIITASAVFTSGEQSAQMFSTILAAIDSISETLNKSLRSAASNPASVLNGNTLTAIQNMTKITYFGVVPIVPAQERTTVPVVPTQVMVGAPPGATNTPPPIAERYPGQ